jgi:hypothetical protein
MALSARSGYWCGQVATSGIMLFLCLGSVSCTAATLGARSVEVSTMAGQSAPQPQTVFGETAQEREELLSHPQSYAPQRLSVEAPHGDVALGNSLIVPVTFAAGRVVDMYIKQFDKNGMIEQESNIPVRIVKDDGLKKGIEVIPAQLGPVTVEIGAIYLDNAWAIQKIQLNVVPSAKGLKRFSLDGGSHADTLVLEDQEEDRQLWLPPQVTYENVRYPIFLNDSTQIKLSVEQDRDNPVIRVDQDGMVHALREGKAVIVGNFDGIIDRLKITVYSKKDAPAGYGK